MQRYVLRADDGPFPDDRGDGASSAETSGSVRLVLPETLGEYEQARAEVEGVGGNAGSEPAQPAEDGAHGMDAASGAATYVVTSSEQRRAWGLPDLGDVAAGPARTCEELQRGMEPRRRAFPSAGRLRVTGTVGPMTRESANVAMTWVRSHAERLVGAARFDDTTDVHVHLAEAARWEGRPVGGGDAGRRPGLGADRTAGAGGRGHERGADARGDGPSRSAASWRRCWGRAGRGWRR